MRQILVFFSILCVINAERVKSSLTFIIDDTGSMEEDIAAVKSKTRDVFDAVYKSNSSVIDNFVLVTFNDPDASVRCNTTKYDEYMEALAKIQVGGGLDCPEMAMKGIYLALENSKPNSFFYVFTDAGAKDYEDFEKVKILSQEKSIQVTFLLTGECDNGRMDLVYDDLAEATSGQVFRKVDKHNLDQVIAHIINTIKSEKTILARQTLSNRKKQLSFTVDSKITDVVISVVGDSPKFSVIDLEGNEVKTETLVRLPHSNVVKFVPSSKEYTVLSNNTKKTSFLITGSTSVTFEHGFSPSKPNSIEETSIKPTPYDKHHLSIKLNNEERDIKLDTVELKDMDENVIMTQKLQLIDDDQQYYCTAPFDPPNIMYRIAVKGLINETERIIRVRSTTVETQSAAPIVNIIGETEVNVDYDSIPSLKCEILGYPKPEFSWEDEFGNKLSSKILSGTSVYRYLNNLNIDSKENATYYCKATNSIGTTKKRVVVNVKKPYFNIIQMPEDQTVRYNESKEIVCKIDASPPATIVWYRNQKQIHEEDDCKVSPDGSTLKILKMHPDFTGKYSCKVSNRYEKHSFEFNVKMSGVEKPKIDTSVDMYFAERNKTVNLPCRLIKGIPKPQITWFFKRNGLWKRLYETGDVYTVNKMKAEDVGEYKCKATNLYGSDAHYMKLYMKYPPTVDVPQKSIIAKEGERVKLKCDIDGLPFPTVQWLKNGKSLVPNFKYQLLGDFTLSFLGSLEDRGTYTCEATSALGKAQENVAVNIYQPVYILSEPKKINVTVGKFIYMVCEADGFPKPKVKWTHYSPKNPGKDVTTFKEDQPILILRHVQVDDGGLYKCTAKNNNSESSITYKVNVNVPATIKRTGSKYFKAYTDDKTLRIPCIAMGSPKPTITWMLGDFIIKPGYMGHIVEDDGTLVITDLSEPFSRDYTCNVQNDFGTDYETYTAEVDVSLLLRELLTV